MSSNLMNLINFTEPIEEFPHDFRPLIIDEDVKQLEVDICNVMEKRVPLDSFPLEYQDKIRNHYRFCATQMTTKNSFIAKRTINTLDII